MIQAQKVKSSHLKRDAYLYVRQSTLRQVLENTESTKRQYGLRDRAVALGWPMERVIVIDADQGQSGASAIDRAGFQRLVAEVGMGHAGIVLGLEVSRLARSSTDWHRLLEICALTDTLILDEDGVYDPSHFNDRLLLGLKGTMSEAELHVLRARLRGGILSKARRGELKQPLPVGFAYAHDDRVVLHPDLQVQQALRLLFDTFRRVGSALGVVKFFQAEGLEFPRRIQTGPRGGDIVWSRLLHSRVLQILKNPRYAGAFFFGKTHTRRTADGKAHVSTLPRDEWQALIRDAHPGYISWEQFEENQRVLHDNAQALGKDRRKSPPREGPALLQGLAICGICGQRMSVRYHVRQGRQYPDYTCVRAVTQHGEAIPCQLVTGEALDAAIGALLLEIVTPLALEVTLTVQHELAARAEEADRLRQQGVERARYEADLAQRRYMRVDPDNRLVADALEADWNQALRSLREAQEHCEQQREAHRMSLDDRQREEILRLATDFPRLWSDPRTPDRERKRMVRLILEDVTLIKAEQITAHVRFRSGACRELVVARPLKIGDLRRTSPLVVQEVDRLLDKHSEDQIAEILDQRGFITGTGAAFTALAVDRIRRAYGLASRYDRLRQAGMLTLEEIGERLGICRQSVLVWRRQGLLRGHSYSRRGDYLFELPDGPLPKKFAHKKPRAQTSSQQNAGGAV